MKSICCRFVFGVRRPEGRQRRLRCLPVQPMGIAEPRRAGSLTISVHLKRTREVRTHFFSASYLALSARRLRADCVRTPLRCPLHEVRGWYHFFRSLRPCWNSSMAARQRVHLPNDVHNPPGKRRNRCCTHAVAAGFGASRPTRPHVSSACICPRVGLLRLTSEHHRTIMEAAKPAPLCESAAQTRSWQAVMPARVASQPLGLLPPP